MEEEFADYFSSVGLAMNLDKSEIIMFYSHCQSQTITVGEQEEADHVKLNSVTVEKGYWFNKHTKILSATISSKVEKLAKVIPFC